MSVKFYIFNFIFNLIFNLIFNYMFNFIFNFILKEFGWSSSETAPASNASAPLELQESTREQVSNFF